MQLKHDIEANPRRHGYYLIDAVACPPILSDPVEADAFLDQLFQRLDDQSWPPPSERPSEQSWLDYEVAADQARRHTVSVLVGGRDIGYLAPTIPKPEAESMWARFVSSFDEPRRSFVGMGFGNRDYAFLHGVVVVGASSAGILWIAESD
ncbi:MAG: hypothetical protein AAGG50_06280 [Bacteroidota bacterium]